MIDTKVYELAERFLEDADIPEELFEGECKKLSDDIHACIEGFISDLPSQREREVEARDDMLGTYPDHHIKPI